MQLTDHQLAVLFKTFRTAQIAMLISIMLLTSVITCKLSSESVRLSRPECSSDTCPPVEDAPLGPAPEGF